MMMRDRSVIIWTEDGCWFQQKLNGVERSSFLGKIGTADQVREWCEGNAIDFADKFHAFTGTAVKEKWPASLPRRV